MRQPEANMTPPPRKKNTKIDREKQAPRRMLYILLGLALVIIIGLVWLFPYVMTTTSETHVIRIPRNATTATLNDTLTKYYGASFASRVTRIATMRRTDLSHRYGSYEIPKGSNAISVGRRLTSGAQTPVTITINGFRSLDNLTDKISRRLDFPADSLKSLLSRPSTLAKYGLTPDQALALFVDDSYQLYWSASPQEVINKIGDNYLHLWTPQRRVKAERLSLSPAEIMTVCSIVDEETNAASEKGTVGQLYINRLKKGMKLQSDPTIRFALNDYTIKRVKGNHLKVDSPYNTYLHTGLPPGPIRTTGATTVDAVLDAPANDWLYMCAKEDFSGTHNFAVTYDEHLKNARRYQEELNRRGIN